MAEPRWFKPEPFCREVLRYSFQELGELEPGGEQSLNNYEEKFREAVETIGKSVAALQLLIRPKVGLLFINAINIVAGFVETELFTEIYDFFNQGYLRSDVFNFTLSSIAVVGELVIFMNQFEIPLPAYWPPLAWWIIYEKIIRDDLKDNGGWDRLLNEAELRYIDSGIYEETNENFRNNNPSGLAEIGDENAWPDDLLAYLHRIFNIVPDSREISMRALRIIYKFT